MENDSPLKNAYSKFLSDNKLEASYTKLGEIDLFEKFLFIDNKKSANGSSDEDVESAEKYEKIFFESNDGTLLKSKYDITRKNIEQQLNDWVENYKSSYNDCQTGEDLFLMMKLLFYPINNLPPMLRHEFEEQYNEDSFKDKLRSFIDFLSDQFNKKDNSFKQRLKLFIVLAIWKMRGYEIAKPVWVRNKLDEWGSKFVLKKKEEENDDHFTFVTILEGVGNTIDKDSLLRGHMIGFNTHRRTTHGDQQVTYENYLDIHVLTTPTLVGDPLDIVFEEELSKSIMDNRVSDDLGQIIQAMFDIFVSNTHRSLEVHSIDQIKEWMHELKKESKNYFEEIYPRLSKIKLSIDKEKVIDNLTFSKIKANKHKYFWAHCDEWAKNCFIDKSDKKLSWLDFEDSVYTRKGSEEIIKNGGRCWRRLTREDEPNSLKLIHLNAMSSLARLFTATLQYYSVKDNARQYGKLSDYPEICGDLLRLLLERIEQWSENYLKEHKNVNDARSFPKIVKSQFLLACLDWAIHWDDHKVENPKRSWDDSNDKENKVFNYLKKTILSELQYIDRDYEFTKIINENSLNNKKIEKWFQALQKSIIDKISVTNPLESRNMKMLLKHEEMLINKLQDLFKNNTKRHYIISVIKRLLRKSAFENFILGKHDNSLDEYVMFMKQMQSSIDFKHDKNSLTYVFCIGLFLSVEIPRKDNEGRHVNFFKELAKRHNLDIEESEDKQLFELVRSCSKLLKHMHEYKDIHTRKTDLLLSVLNNIKD